MNAHEHLSKLRNDRESAMRDYVWACPNCKLGWQHYDIHNDSHTCPQCGYAGGETRFMARMVSERDDAMAQVVRLSKELERLKAALVCILEVSHSRQAQEMARDALS